MSAIIGWARSPSSESTQAPALTAVSWSLCNSAQALHWRPAEPVDLLVASLPA